MIRPLHASVALLLSMSAGEIAAQNTRDLAITNVTIIDPERGVLRDQTVVIRGARVQAVGPARSVRVSPAALRLDGRGQYAIPGLWDMHFHMTGWQATAPEMLIAYGVTGVRDMGGEWSILKPLRDSIRAGLRTGPRLVLAGPTVDGEKRGAMFRHTIRTREDGAAAVDSLRRLGVDFIKVHNGVPRDAYFGLLAAARQRGVAVAGHVPLTVTPTEAISAGQRSLEHVATIFEGTFIAGYPNPDDQLRVGEAFIAAGADTLAQRMVSNRTWFDPTLYAYKLRIRRGQIPPDADSLMRYVSAATSAWWASLGLATPRDTAAPVIAARQRFYEGTARMTNVFFREGVPLLAGTDVAGPGLFPGYSLHEELHALVRDAGLSPLAAIRAATLEPARYFAADSLGAIAPGKVADIVLLNADPLTDIRNSTRIAAVVLRGRHYDRAALDALLATAARTAAQPKVR